jgi:hypothetical protein
MKMPWGRYKNQRLESIPLTYLLWVLGEAEGATPSLRQEIERILHGGTEVSDLEEQLAEARRHSIQLKHQLDAKERELQQAVFELATRPEIGSWWRDWKRRAVMTCHPDRNGGDDRAMKLVNELAEHLEH